MSHISNDSNGKVDSSGKVAFVLPNNVRVEKVHSLLLKISCVDIGRVSDWDLKQCVRKLDPLNIIPLCENIDRRSDKSSVLFQIIYDDIVAIKIITEKILIARGYLKINSHILTVSIITNDEITNQNKDILHDGKHDSTKNKNGQNMQNLPKIQNLQNSIWIKNLPIRWFELDSSVNNNIIPKEHSLRNVLQNSYGNILQMESKNHFDDSSLLCDVCVQFSEQKNRKIAEQKEHSMHNY